ncbi:hypothetical protein TNIN_378021 [Trichonephila inaurata madagascariensis]|uniref:Uncharacterized protein n=1 Tax=Trichonephila inaurata madagascariensis TaxID=2747483 RepID=A0A8X7BSH3_9ARAC|nr:hypothetical protein TNIN_378021 [Trichonephila inaurata madagascariensis]
MNWCFEVPEWNAPRSCLCISQSCLFSAVTGAGLSNKVVLHMHLLQAMTCRTLERYHDALAAQYLLLFPTCFPLLRAAGRWNAAPPAAAGAGNCAAPPVPRITWRETGLFLLPPPAGIKGRLLHRHNEVPLQPLNGVAFAAGCTKLQNVSSAAGTLMAHQNLRKADTKRTRREGMGRSEPAFRWLTQTYLL